MNATVIIFPPGGGGNHLKNLITGSLLSLLRHVYQHATVHSKPGVNFSHQELLEKKITLGHFGEILSHRDLLRPLPDIKFIILSPDSVQDRRLLHERCMRLGIDRWIDVAGYWDGEQVFLYEPFMYNLYLGTPMENIMNISISDFFKEDILQDLVRISNFVNTEIDYDQCLMLHKIWLQNNNLAAFDV